MLGVEYQVVEEMQRRDLWKSFIDGCTFCFTVYHNFGCQDCSLITGVWLISLGGKDRIPWNCFTWKKVVLELQGKHDKIKFSKVAHGNWLMENYAIKCHVSENWNF